MEKSLVQEKIAPVWFYSLAVLITQLDGGAVSTLLSSVMKQYAISSATASWMSGLYTLGLVIATPVVANLIDIYGERRLFLAELACWFAGALVTFLGPNYEVVLAGRAIQAVGDCGIIVMSIDAMIVSARANHQGRKVSLMGIMSGLAALLAPIVAGLTVASTQNWHSFYGLMLPLIFILFLLGWKVLPNQVQTREKHSDRAGAIVFSLGLATWMVALTLAQQIQRFWPVVLILIIVGMICFAFFPAIERRLPGNRQPFLPLKLLKKRTYLAAVILGTLGGMFFPLFVYIPTYGEQVFHLPVQMAGMILTAPGLGSIIGSAIGGVMVDKAGTRTTLIAASCLMMLATVGIVFTITSLSSFLLFSFVMGCGMGALMSAPLQVIAGRLAGHNDRAEAIGGLSACKKVGLTIGPLFFATSMDLLAKGGRLTILSFQSIFMLAALIALICVGIAAIMPRGGNDNE